MLCGNDYASRLNLYLFWNHALLLFHLKSLLSHLFICFYNFMLIMVEGFIIMVCECVSMVSLCLLAAPIPCVEESNLLTTVVFVLYRFVGYEGLEVVNPEGGTEDSEEEAKRGRWKQEVHYLHYVCTILHIQHRGVTQVDWSNTCIWVAVLEYDMSVYSSV